MTERQVQTEKPAEPLISSLEFRLDVRYHKLKQKQVNGGRRVTVPGRFVRFFEKRARIREVVRYPSPLSFS